MLLHDSERKALQERVKADERLLESCSLEARPVVAQRLHHNKRRLNYDRMARPSLGMDFVCLK